MALTFGSLFAGIGGMDLGLERTGMQCKWQVEIDEYATRVLERHWPHVRRWRDVTTFPPNADKCTDWSVDLIAAGFPCQDISYAGQGAGLDGERSGLFWDAMRVVRILGSRYVLLENVAALLARGLPEVLGSLASLGYDAEWHCIPSASVGAPHIRDRVFIIGHTNGDGQSTGPQHAEATRLPAMDADANGQRLEGSKLQRKQHVFQQRPCDQGWWSTEPGVGRVAHGVPRRMDRLRGLGNAVVPQVAEFIGRAIVESLD